MIYIQGYHLNEELYNGSKTLVYRGIRKKDEKPVVIKLLKNSYPSFNELLQFRNQYTIAKNLNIPGIIRPYSLEAYQNAYALVMEDFGGISLREYIKTKNITSIEDILSITLQITDILHVIHQNRVIHKDIKPDNILINPETKQIKLIDFSIASLLPKETQSIKNPNSLEGTLAYISPEQTGRMNRGIDYRSDYYSLGITFYELLTGELPFKSDDAMELVHCHIAKQPPLIKPHPNPLLSKEREEEIPQVLSDIVIKLMAKNAEDRYQSALGIKHDLAECLSQWKEIGGITEFELGQRDLCDRFVIPEKLYGREAEVQTLLDAFERVSQGSVELMLVAGYSGVGKTAVVNEVHKPITRQRGYFIKGKFDQFNRNIPFSAFVQAFRSLMGQILSESDAQLQQWKAKILEAVGESGQVLIEVIPELERIIGYQPPVPELFGSAAQNRFNLLFQKFIAVFTTPDHPLVMFLDDLQWADSASLNLLQLLMVESETGHLLILGAYRDNEVFPAHPLMLSLEDIRKRCDPADVSSAKERAPREHQVQIHTLTLKPLTETHIHHLVADTLLCARELAAPLGELVYQKTQGNPFFATQFLQGLYEDDCITFNAEGYWQCDLAQVKQLALTDDVVEFMVGRLRKLPQATQEVLKLAACIGNQFDLNTLAIVCDRALNAATTDLWPSLQEGLVIPENETYKFFQGDGGEVTDVEDIKIGYRFLHDRVQQAAYTLIPKEEKQKIHYHIGNLLLQKIPLEEREDRIFELVSQLNHGIDLITEPQERNELAALNLMACRQARKSTAYEAGRDCGRNGLLLLGENPWQCDYDISLALHEYSAEFAFLCGDLEAMQQLVDVIVLRAKTALDKVNAYRVIIQVNTLQNQLNQAIIIARRFLQELEVMLPENPNPNDIQRAFAEIDQLMENRGLGDLAHLPIMTDEKKLAIVRITNSIMAAAYLTGSPLFPLLAALTVKISIQHGNSLDSALAYASYGVMICNLLGDINTGVSFGQLAIQVSSHPNFRPAKPEVLNVAGLWVLHRNTHIKETLPILQEGYEVGLEVGNLLYAGYNAFNFCANSFWCGQLLTELEQTIRSHCQRLEQLNQLNSANYGCIYWQSILNLRGAVEQPTILSGEALQEARILPSLLEANDSYGLFYFYLCKLILSYLFGEFESAHNHGIELRKYLKSGAGVMGIAIFYFYDSLTILRRLNKGDVANQSIQTERDEKLKQLGENQIILQQQWADFAPMNHQHKVDLIEAEKHRLLEQNLEAIELYNRAIAGAKENGFIHEVALANELAAKFYLDWGKENYAALHMQSAYYCYAKWGAKAKTEDLEKRYPDLLQPILQQAAVSINLGETFPQNTTQTSNSSVTNINNALDFSSILKASQTLSSTIELNQLLTQFTQIILHNSGGDCCALILPNVKGEWYVEAITTASETKLCYEPLENNPN
ncbi:MAG: serine/threonine-protein kinase PknK [Cyanobacteria bacterium J06633_8]